MFKRNLQIAIINKYRTMAEFADVMNISNSALSKKMHGERKFNQYEIAIICEKLCIPKTEIQNYI